ncbi:hypothetical protein L861_06485 [Litchfieldella anticariensis FP35 = DSM 16096]|uniref:TraD/TraG TraM recognition site domain-containing protein n=1 Tax=Litchfieldella anticariensis (strain DSM 16096 / CECT 5854 / CIP 108499 / LMG 22089 / FP35) TaxID=1121939 RepID=S2L773_LITA3|nr:type IV conjugative transfer system coupling protein TraD [Halomonas anticariensis]EPC00581.1 hypothetical protein L861_06485 [Halomonas anticariensis FP35 = DSM 16096]
MSQSYPLESLLRPAVELNTVVVCVASAVLCVVAPWAVALTPSVGIGMAAGFLGFGLWRLRQAWVVLRYRRHMRRLPRFALRSDQIPVSPRSLWLGKGFRWEAKHTQRLHESFQPEAKPFVQPSLAYRIARHLENRLERYRTLYVVIRLLSADTILNPFRPLPPVGGIPALHAVEWREMDVRLPLGERVGHTLVEGTTRVGKTRLEEVMITQDIHRPSQEVVICFDPKGDGDLLLRMYIEALRAGRGDEFYIFHLGWPDISARYNAVGRFGRISEVATRLAGQLSGEGNSAAFREFAWRFTNIIARARHALGQRPTYDQILSDVVNIDGLMIEYAQQTLVSHDTHAWESISEIESRLNDKSIPIAMKGRDRRVVAIEQYLQKVRVHDAVLEGLRSAVRYDKTYFDKIVASLLPLLEKLTSGRIAELLSPDYHDLEDPRPIFDWQQIIRKRGIVYVGLDALSDFEVAQAVGNSMFADLVSVAGHIYKHGIDDGLPGAGSGEKVAINLHCDEFNELMGDEFVPLVNKGGGAGIQITAYTQTLSDIEARIGNAAKAGQVVGNFNNLIMLRVREEKTAELLTRQLRKVNVANRMLVSMAGDNSDVTTDIDFTSSGGDRISTVQVPMIEPADVVSLPKGQAFALLEGGQLWKVRMPLPKPDRGKDIPRNITDIAHQMKSRYSTGERWWEAVMPPPIHFEPPEEASRPGYQAIVMPSGDGWNSDNEPLQEAGHAAGSE